MAQGAVAHAEKVTLVGMLVNVALAGVKLTAGLVGHSYALVADAIESMGDIVASVVIWGGLRYANRPPDEDHPYGHGKGEALAALVVSAMLVAAGVGIAVKAVDEIITPHHAPAPFTLIVLVVVVAAKETMFRIARRAARKAGSNAVATDAWHHRADAITSIAAFIGISVALIGGKGWEPADDVAALVARAFIIIIGGLLLRQDLAELTDKTHVATAAKAESIARSIEGVHGTHKAHARKSGSRVYIDMHLEVDPTMSVADAHIVSGKVKSAIRQQMSEVANVLIHIEPAQERTA
jgi:cation diffusion facilitator family transporter